MSKYHVHIALPHKVRRPDGSVVHEPVVVFSGTDDEFLKAKPAHTPKPKKAK